MSQLRLRLVIRLKLKLPPILWFEKGLREILGSEEGFSEVVIIFGGPEVVMTRCFVLIKKIELPKALWCVHDRTESAAPIILDEFC